MHYVMLLVVRLAVLVLGVALLVERPEELSITHRFGPMHGLSYPNLVFLLMLADMLTKLFPRAHIAVGSLKQYRRFHAPTPLTVGGGKDGLARRVRELVDRLPAGDEALELVRRTLRDGQERGRELYDRGRAAIDETRAGLRDGAQQLLRSIDVLRVLPFEDEDLTVGHRMRSRIRSDRFRQTVPVLVFWVAFNVAAALVLGHLGLLTEQVVLLWTMVYFVFDMVCVVLWCPLQILLMRNRCCTTCQIFNWDAIMYTTPLFLLRSPFSLLLIASAVVVLVRWELAFFRHPERFDERTNASLKCANCSDKLCYLRGSLRELQSVLPSQDSGAGQVVG